MKIPSVIEVGGWRIGLNAPFVLGYAAVSLIIMVAHTVSAGYITERVFGLSGNASWAHVFTYVLMVLHVIGHESWSHFFSSFVLLFLLGPLLEEKYGTKKLLLLATVTAVTSGLFHVLLFSGLLVGSGGIVFMMVLLCSLVNLEAKTIPITFLLVVVFFLGDQLLATFSEERHSQAAHLIGGAVGAAAGYWLSKQWVRNSGRPRDGGSPANPGFS